MSDVSCRVFEYFEVAARDYGFSIEELVDGLDVSLDELRRPDHRVPWPAWADLCSRLHERIGPDGLYEVSFKLNDMNMSQVFRAVTAGAVSVERLYSAVCNWLAPHLFRHARYQLTVHSSDRFTVDLFIPDDQPGSVPWLRMNEGALASVPLLLGAPPAEIHARYTPHHGRYDILCDVKQPLLRRLWRTLRSRVHSGSVLDELTKLQRDLRHAYRERADAERELREVLARLPDPVSVWCDTKSLYSNEAWQSAFSHRAPEEFESLLRQDRLRREVGVEDPRGIRRTYVSPPAVSVRFRGQQAHVLMLRDVTAERADAEKAALTERLTLLGTLAACVGHEINNPLAYVTASLESTLTELQSGHPLDIRTLQEGLSVALDGLHRVASISQDLNTFARQEAARQPVRLADVLDLALRITGNQIRHVARIERDDGSGSIWVEADFGQLGQVFVNLIVNAAQAMQGGRPDSNRLSLRIGRQADRAHVRVEDTGVGMPPEILGRVFDPFVTTKGDRGTGLGLAICEKIVTDHGGWIDVASHPGEGSTFTVWLPTIDEPPPRPKTIAEPVLQNEALWRILVVDDEPMLAELIRRLLQPHRVESARSAEEAWDRLLNGEQDFDAILCDVMMPGTTGVDFHRRLTIEAPDLAARTVFLTGGAFTPDSQAYLRAVECPCLIKPFRQAELRAVLTSVVKR